MTENPCKECEERFEACHDKCERYAEWRAEFMERKEKIREGRGKEYTSKAVWSKSMRKRIMGR